MLKNVKGYVRKKLEVEKMKAPGVDLQGLVGVKNEGRSLFIFYKLIDIYTKLKSQDFFKILNLSKIFHHLVLKPNTQ